MARSLRPSTLIPAGLALVDAQVEDGRAVITVRSCGDETACPDCGAAARRVHSRYVRILADLPLGGRAVRLQFVARRFRCDAALCPRRIFGFRGSRRVVTEWATRRRRAEEANLERLKRTPSARTVARLMTTARDDLSRAQTVTVAAIEAAAHTLVEAREIVEAFHAIIRKKKSAALDKWLEWAGGSLIASFARGLARDRPAVLAAIDTAWSNAQAEGQITKPKLVKRQMYGRGKLDLLQARLTAGG
jgi:transposase